MAKSNSLYLIIGALVVIVAGLGFYVYREETKPEGVSISIGEGGVQVQEE
jgi:RsiW-degrading membrane proteinase PrsW (M82 family)